jgi:PAS domain S-box-containing protein
MTLQYTPVVLPLLLGTAVSAGLAIYGAVHRRAGADVLAFVLLCAFASQWCLGETLQWATSNTAWQYTWLRFTRLGVQMVPLFWFVFAAEYTGWQTAFSRRAFSVLGAVVALTVLLAWTNPWHQLVWSAVTQVEFHGVARLVVQRGPYWMPIALYNYAMLLGGAGLFAVALIRSPDRYRGRAPAIIIGSATPFAANIFYTLHPTPVDPTPLALVVSAVAYAWGVFRHRMLDLVPIARHTIIENMADAMFVLDENGRLLDANSSAKRILARTNDNLIGRPLAESVPAWTQLLGDIDKAASNEGEVAVDGHDYELRISPVRNKDGALTGRVVLLHDITDQKQACETLRRTEETSRTILESIEDGYYEIDLRGTFTKATEATAKVIGLPRAQVIGANFVQLTDDSTATRLLDIYGEVFRTGAALKDLEYSITTLGGETKYLEASASLMRDVAGRPIGFRGMVRDTTERKRTEQELQAAKRAAEEASQAKGAFLATVSHELRTPLTSVLGFAKLIKRRLSETVHPAAAGADPKVQRALQQVSDNVDIIVAEGERLTTLINEVLDLAKIESGKIEWHMQPLAVAEIIARAIAATTSLSEAKALAVRSEIEDTLPRVLGDPDRLIQVVINLLSNAIKFTDHGRITCRARRNDGAIEVAVADTGAGIAPEDQPRVFEQFVQVGDTLTGRPTGTGLGLPICKQIIEHHGGRIWVESTVGQGSTFAFTLPIDGATARPEPSPEPPPRIELDALVDQLRQRLGRLEPTDGDARTVLIVDDDPSIRSLLRQELEAAGHAVREARSGEEALAAVKQERPGLIILDVIMPGLSGFDVAAALRNDPQTLDIPVIILSVVHDRERGVRLGVEQYFTKPVSTEVLMHEVDTLLTRGPAKKKVLVVDEDAATVDTLSAALAAQGYSVITAHSGPDGIARALVEQPDLVLVRSLLSEQHGMLQALRSSKEMKAVSFLLFE